MLTELSTKAIKISANEIIQQLAHKNVTERCLRAGKIKARPEAKTMRVEYYIDIREYEIARFPSILNNIQTYNDFEKDVFHPYPIKNIETGISLCKEFCKLMSIEFTTAHEKQLVDGVSVGKPLYLIIIERPF